MAYSELSSPYMEISDSKSAQYVRKHKLVRPSYSQAKNSVQRPYLPELIVPKSTQKLLEQKRMNGSIRSLPVTKKDKIFSTFHSGGTVPTYPIERKGHQVASSHSKNRKIYEENIKIAERLRSIQSSVLN